MRLLVCEECGARHFSAAAEALAARGAHCERCSSPLELAEDDERLVAAAVGPETESGRLRRPD